MINVISFCLIVTQVAIILLGICVIKVHKDLKILKDDYNSRIICRSLKGKEKGK